MKSSSQSSTVTHHRHFSSLVLKDSLRELRLNAKRSAQAVVADVESAVSQFPAPLGKPLGIVARAATQVLELADRAVVDLLTSDQSLRTGDFRLRQSFMSVQSSNLDEIFSLFSRQYYWSAKLLLRMKEQPDFFIKEQAFHEAFDDFETDVPAFSKFLDPSSAIPGSPSAASLISARIILSLLRARPVACIHAVTVDDAELIQKLSALNLQVCVAVVLASEITAGLPASLGAQDASAVLRLADEIVAARMDVWDWIAHGPSAQYQMAREMDFVSRHV